MPQGNDQCYKICIRSVLATPNMQVGYTNKRISSGSNVGDVINTAKSGGTNSMGTLLLGATDFLQEMLVRPASIVNPCPQKTKAWQNP